MGKVPLFSIFGIGGVIELVGGALIALGLFTRIAAFIASGEMAVAYWMFHAPDSIYPIVNGGDAAILYCFVFLYIAVAGPGKLQPRWRAAVGEKGLGLRLTTSARAGASAPPRGAG